MDSPSPLFFAVTWIGREHRFLGLDWSYLTVLGFIGNLIFATRFILQWIASERKGESVIPIAFWYWSIAGSLVLSVYFVCKREPVGILATLPNSFIYFRNLHLIRKAEQNKACAAAGLDSEVPGSVAVKAPEEGDPVKE